MTTAIVCVGTFYLTQKACDKVIVWNEKRKFKIELLDD